MGYLQRSGGRERGKSGGGRGEVRFRGGTSLVWREWHVAIMYVGSWIARSCYATVDRYGYGSDTE